MDRNLALELLKQHIKNEKLLKHCLAVEAIMQKLAEMLGEDKEKWGLVGLLHDIDYELTKNEPERHGSQAREILEGKVDEEIIKAIESHNELANRKAESKLEKALIASDQVSGLIIASALIIPTKCLKDLELKTVLNKFKQKDFARNVNREKIKLCQELGLSLEKFLGLALEALKEISSELGL
jgi:hypothetical protein